MEELYGELIKCIILLIRDPTLHYFVQERFWYFKAAEAAKFESNIHQYPSKADPQKIHGYTPLETGVITRREHLP